MVMRILGIIASVILAFVAVALLIGLAVLAIFPDIIGKS